METLLLARGDIGKAIGDSLGGLWWQKVLSPDTNLASNFM